MICSKLLVVLIIAFVSESLANEAKLTVLKQPSFLEHNYASKALKLSQLDDLLLAVNGFSIPEGIEWTGLKSTNALARPKVTLLFMSNNIEDSMEKSIKIDEDSSVNFRSLVNHRNTEDFIKFQDLPIESKVSEMKCEKGIYIFKASGSEQTNQINEVVEHFKNCLSSDDDLLAYKLETTSEQRYKREVREKRALSNSILNRAILYSDNYPVQFHLFFWTSLLLGLTVIAVTCGMSNMDPGLDTVIYRMTSQRIKKDN